MSTMKKTIPVMNVQEWNKKGDNEYEKGNFSEALSHYKNALRGEKDDTYKGIYYSNIAAAYLKLNDYEKAVENCDSALKVSYNKALYHRCQALEALERFQEAYRDAEIIILSDPNNKDFQCIAERLQEHKKRSAKISKFLDEAFYVYASEKERESAMDMLFALARDKVTTQEIFKKEGVLKIAQLVKVEKNEGILCSAIRIVGELCKNNISQTESVMESVGSPWFLEIMNSTFTERVNASQCCLQNILNTYNSVANEFDSKSDKALCAVYKRKIDTILLCLLHSITSNMLTGLARDAIIELIMRNVHCVTKLDWAKQFVELRGVQRLMEVASEMEEYKNKYKSSMDITSFTQTVTSACLEKIYENIYCDDEETFINGIDKFIKDKLNSPGIESQVRIIVAITALLSSSLDVGNAVVAREEILKMVLVMAETDDVLQQKVALECIVAAMKRKDKVNAIINQGVNILKKLCQSKDDLIQVRTLVAFCKMGNSVNSDATTKPFANYAELTEACNRLLINPEKEKNTKEWAIEGLSYLTFNSRVRKMIIEDKETIPMMIEIAKTGDRSVLFGVLTTLVNLCDAYDKDEPEMIELAKFVNCYFPNEYELSDDDFVKITLAIGAADVISVLLNLAKTASQNCKELIARVINAVCLQDGVKEVVFEQGGMEPLVSLALDGTVKGKRQASLALAVMQRPEVTFSDQLLTQFVQLIVNLLNLEYPVNENYQALIALRNLATINDSMREHIVKEGVFQKIEGFRNKEDHLLRLGSARLINILLLSREVAIQYFEQDNSRVEYLMLLYNDGNQQVKFPAAAALVKLSVANKEACQKVFDSNFWPDFLRSLLTNPSNNIQGMGVIFVLSMIRCVKDVAAKLNETDIMELLRKLRNNNSTAENSNIMELTSIALEATEERSSKEALSVITWERDTACRLGQLVLLNRLEIKLWVYEPAWVRNLVPLNVYSEFGKILPRW